MAENRKAQQELQTERSQQEQLVNSTRKKEGEYASQIKQKRSQADELDRQIQKLIREAIAESNKKAGAKATGGSATTFALTPEGRLIANNFAANKGSLIWPVERGYKSQGYGQYAWILFIQMSNTIIMGLQLLPSKERKLEPYLMGKFPQ